MRESLEIWGERQEGDQVRDQVRQMRDYVKVAGESGERQLRGLRYVERLLD